MRFSTMLVALALTVPAIAMATQSKAHDYKAGLIAIGHPFARATPASAPVAGGYLTLTNTGKEADILLSGSSPVSEKLELHLSTLVEGVAKMRQIEDGIEIKPGETVALKAGASHIMFLRPRKQLVEGERFPVTLNFKNAGPITVDFAVQGLGPSKAAEDHDDHKPKAE